MQRIPFPRREDLGYHEMHAIAGYQDLINPQSHWSHSIPKSNTTGANCYMINNTMKGKIKPKGVDLVKVNRYIELIDSAIHKYRSSEPITLYRGYTNPAKMLAFNIGDVFIEKSFISSSETEKVAHKYATTLNVETPVISVCEYEPNTPMLYLNQLEDEWLLPPFSYRIDKIVDANIYSKSNKKYKGKSFYIKRVK